MKLLKLTALLLVFGGSVALCSDKEKVETPQQRIANKLDDVIWLLANKEGNTFSWDGQGPSTADHGIKLVKIQTLSAQWVKRITQEQNADLLKQQANLRALATLQAQLTVPGDDGKEQRQS